MKRAVCLQHVAFEGPGYFEPALRDLGFDVQKHIVPHVGLPKDGGDLLLVMGGPMSVNDPDPWIAAETEFIRAHVTQGRPYLGVCLGSQFLAKAIGGRVYAGRQPEIGMTAIELTRDGRRDPAFRGADSPLQVFEWHGEGIELPPGTVNLASSSLFPVQAFRHGGRAYGLLFHLEIDPDGADKLCCACAGDVARASTSASRLVDDLRPHVQRLQEQARHVVNVLAETVHAS